jgi:predicted metal-dependent phosphoesterase TrpH
MKEFNHIPDMGEFIETIMNENCPAYVKKFSITPIEASKIIKSANGKVILAHPVCYVYEDNLEVEKIFELIKLMDIDGIEAHYLFLNKDNINQDDSKFWDDYAKENKLLSTLGSDFHQLDNKHIELGFNNSSFKISSDEENEIIEYITKKV